MLNDCINVSLYVWRDPFLKRDPPKDWNQSFGGMWRNLRKGLRQDLPVGSLSLLSLQTALSRKTSIPHFLNVADGYTIIGTTSRSPCCIWSTSGFRNNATSVSRYKHSIPLYYTPQTWSAQLFLFRFPEQSMPGCQGFHFSTYSTRQYATSAEDRRFFTGQWICVAPRHFIVHNRLWVITALTLQGVPTSGLPQRGSRGSGTCIYRKDVIMTFCAQVWCIQRNGTAGPGVHQELLTLFLD